MFTHALRKIRKSVISRANGAPMSPQNLFEVHLIGDQMARFGVVPLSFTTPYPKEVAADLMRDRDPQQWSVEIQPRCPDPLRPL